MYYVCAIKTARIQQLPPPPPPNLASRRDREHSNEDYTRAQRPL